MILYKYVNYKTGLTILKDNTITFSQPKYFNDPAELEASYPTNDYQDVTDFYRMTKQRELKKLAWKEYSAILSLTRAANNPLMWSHYSEKHKGFVIGFEVNQELFTSEKLNLLPVQYGNVICTATKPIHEFLTTPDHIIEVANEVSFNSDILERLQRIFLYKPMCWSYEEEVRVVKNIFKKNEDGTFASGINKVIQLADQEIYVIDLPPNTIKEVHIGLRNPIYKNKNGELKSLIDHTRTYSKNIKYYECRHEDSSWYIGHLELLEDISSLIEKG